MGFEEGARSRLRRYRGEADRSMQLMREAEEAAGRFSERLFTGLEYVAALGREAGFEVEAARGVGGTLSLRISAGAGAASEATFGLLEGAAAETHEDLMHEELSSYVLEPSGYSGRILGFSEQVGEEPCQVFAVYADGVWRTRGVFVEKARGRLDDPDEVINGFCLRIFGRLIDLAAPTGGSGRSWAEGPYALADLLDRIGFPIRTRWFR